MHDKLIQTEYSRHSRPTVIALIHVTSEHRNYLPVCGVPIIKPLRLVLDAIKPEIASGWMFPNTIGGALDLDNLADRVIKPILKANGLE